MDRIPSAFRTTGRPADRQTGPALNLPIGARWLAALVFLITLLQQEAELFRWRLFLPMLAATLLVGLWRARAELRSVRTVLLAGSLFAGSLLLTAVPFFNNPSLWSVYRFFLVAAPVLAAWTFFLLVLPFHAGARSPEMAEDQHGGAAARDIRLAGPGALADAKGLRHLLR
jgi:hypothetical protein